MSKTNNNPNSKSLLSQWLEQIQQDSWQLELLISGLALYGVYNGIEKIEDYLFFVNINSSDEVIDSLLMFLYGLFYVGWRIFFFNLLIHVILRGLWIASIGLRYVSDDIDFEELDYAPVYTEYLKKKIGSYDEFIEKIEKLCSIMFAFTFLIFLFFVSLAVFTYSAMLPIVYIQSFNEWWEVIILLIIFIYLLCGIIVAIDFLTLGSLKKIRDPWFVKIYSPIFKFVSYASLSFLYRPLLYNFLDQKYTRRFLLLAIPYVIVIAFGDSLFTQYMHPHKDNIDNLVEEGLIINDYHYQDLLDERLFDMSSYERKKYINQNMPSTQLSNYHVKDGQLEIFFKTNTRFINELLSDKHNLSPIYKEGLVSNLFSDHEIENKEVLAIQRGYLSQYSTMRKAYNKYRDRVQQEMEEEEYAPYLKSKRDSINKVVDSLENLKAEEIAEYKSDFNRRVFELMVATYSVKIDSIDYTDILNCHYFTNRYDDNEGILCNLYDARLPKGNKVLEATRSYKNSFTDSISTSTIKLPIHIH